MLVYNDNIVTLKAVYNWYEQFKSGNACVEDEPRLGRPSTSKPDKEVHALVNLVRSNSQLTNWEFVKELNILYESVATILTGNLQMRRINA